jgi:AraC-like DNA-binding protein
MKLLPQNLHVFKMKSVFVRILLFFVLVIFISIILLGLISYWYSSGLLIKEVMNSNLMLIQKAKSDVDKEIVNLDRLTFQLSLQPKIKSALYSTGNDLGYDQAVFTDSIRIISSAKMANDKISSMWVYFDNSKVILNNNAKFSKDIFFNNVCIYKNDINWSIVKDNHPNLISLGRQEVILDSKRETDITFARAISIDDAKPLGIVSININEENFRSTLNDIDQKVPSFTYVVDFNGTPVLSSMNSYNEEMGNSLFAGLMLKQNLFSSDEGYLRNKIAGKDYLVVFTTSHISKWRYITIIPTEVVTEKANKIRQITVIAALLCLLLGLVFSYLLTSRIYYPVNELVNYINAFKIKRRINDGESREDELTFINRIMDYIYRENENLKDLFEQNIPILKEKLLYDLIEGKMSSEDFYDTSRKLNIDFPFSSFEVIIFDMEDNLTYNKNFKGCLTIEKKIAEIAAERYYKKLKIYSLKKGNDKIITILNISSDSLATEIIYDFIKEVKCYFSSVYELIFTVGIGGVYKTPIDISLSFSDASSALKYKLIKGYGSITHIDETGNIPEHIFQYSIETEKQIINFLKAGNLGKLKEILDAIVNENILSRETSPEIIENLFSALAGTAIRTIYEIGGSVKDVFDFQFNIYKHVLEKNKIEDKLNYLLNIFEMISSYINSRKQKHNQKIMDKVSIFIDSNYFTDISLTQVCEEVGLSSTYLSSIFKEISGKSFVDYVNSIRIEKSKQLLVHKDLTIIQVAEKVGFYSSNTYIKCFKKQEGITPGQFRDLKL